VHRLLLFLTDSWIKSMWSVGGRDPDDPFLSWEFVGVLIVLQGEPVGSVKEGGWRVGSSRALRDSSDGHCLDQSRSDCHCLRDLNVCLDAFPLSGFSVRSRPFSHHSFGGKDGFLTSPVF